MNCIILGDKYAKGMKSRGCPALLSYNKRNNIIQHQINFIKKFLPESKVIYIYGHCSDSFDDFIKKDNICINKIYNSEYEKYGQFNSLSLAEKFMDSECLIFDGYSNLKKSYIRNIKKNKKESFVVLDNKNSDGAGCVVVENKIKNFGYSLPYSIKHIYYLNKEAMSFVKRFCSSNKHRNYFIFEILNEILEQNVFIKPVIL
jgi:choline kinase